MYYSFMNVSLTICHMMEVKDNRGTFIAFLLSVFNLGAEFVEVEFLGEQFAENRFSKGADLSSSLLSYTFSPDKFKNCSMFCDKSSALRP